jgi:hypothetical protein
MASRVSPVVHVRVNPWVKLIADVAGVRSSVGAAHATHTTSASTLDTNVARGVGTMILVRIDAGVKLVGQVGVVVSSVGRAYTTARAHARGRVVAVVLIRIDARVELVGYIARMRSSIGRTGSGTTVVHIGVKAGIKLVACVCAVGAVVVRCRDGRDVVADAVGRF